MTEIYGANRLVEQLLHSNGGVITFNQMAQAGIPASTYVNQVAKVIPNMNSVRGMGYYQSDSLDESTELMLAQRYLA